MSSNKDTQRILLFPAGTPQREAFIEAKKKGLFIITMDGNENAECREFADQFFHVNPADVDAAVSLAKTLHVESPIDGVLLVGCDLPVTCASIAKACGLPGPEVDSARLTVNKFEMKERFTACGVAVPRYYKVSSLDDIVSIVNSAPASTFVLKPNDNCGARGISLIRDQAEVAVAFERAMSCCRADTFLILEEFVEGPQISIEGIDINGSFHVVGIADRNYSRFEEYYPYVIEDGADIPSILPLEAIKEICRVFTAAAKALGIKNCVAKGDMVWSNGKAYVIEVASRISGGKFASRLVPEATGVNLLSIAIDAALGWHIAPDRFIPSLNRSVTVRYFFTKSGKLKTVNGVSELHNAMNVIDMSVQARAGQFLPSITSHADRRGWVVCSGDSRAESQRCAKEAMEQIKFIFEEGI